MKTVELNVVPRVIGGKKSELRNVREGGSIPAVIYGKGQTTSSVLVDSKVFEKMMHSGLGANVLINVKLEGKENTCIVKELQRDIISGKPIHIDFHVVNMTEKIEVSVPVKVMGMAPGVKNSGGILELIMHEIKVKCLPADIPHHIEIDVTSLQVGQGIIVKDIPAITGVELLVDPSLIVCNVVMPKVEEAPAPADAAAAVAGAAAPAEPEVISKGKKDKEGEAAAEEKPKK